MKSDVKYYSIFKLACPIFFQMLLSMCLGYIDTIMVSQYSETAVGALGNAGQIFTFLSVAFTVSIDKFSLLMILQTGLLFSASLIS